MSPRTAGDEETKDMVLRQEDRLHPLRWLVFAVLLLAVAGGLGSLGGLGRADHALADAARLFDTSEHRSDIVVVAIDDASLNALGPLPWPEGVYAKLVETLAAAQPRVVGVITPWNRRYLSMAANERPLVQAVARAGNVVLPVTMTGAQGRTPVAIPPEPGFARAAGALGHVHTLLDSDGVARSVFLREGPREQPWDHMALALYKLGAGDVAGSNGNGGGDHPWQRLPDDGTAQWLAENRLLVPFTHSRVKHIPFVDVVAGLAQPEEFRNRYVLVGSAASGVGNAFATPVGMRGQLMPETDMVAAVLQALLEQRYIEPAGPVLNAVANMAPALVVALALPLLSGAAAAALLLGTAVVVVGGMAVLPLVAQVQVYPAASLVALLLAYPLWVSVRLFSAMRSLSAEVVDMQPSMFLPAPVPAPAPGADMIERHIGRLHDAIDQLRNTQRLVSDSLDSVPDFTLILDAGRRVQIANLAAQRYLRSIGVEHPTGLSLREIALPLVSGGTMGDVAAKFEAQPPATFDKEMTGANGHAYLMRGIPRFGPARELMGWIVSIIDIHSVREAQRQRDDAMRFISHDMRSPNSSILSLLEIHERTPEDKRDTARLHERIRRYARTALDISEDFIQLSRAESGVLTLHEEDLHVMLGEAADLVWGRAQERNIRIHLPDPEDAAPCMADRSLMTRAFMNLLDNAVKFSPEGTEIHCEIAQEGGHWRVSVRDQGPGLPVSDAELLFEKFRRGESAHMPRIQGAGLGLAFVKSVVLAHGGSVNALNCTEQGAEFRVCLPLAGPRGSHATEDEQSLPV